MGAHNELGKSGERHAVQFLKDCGYDILEINYRYGKAEIDIIGRQNEVLVFFEVKTRRTRKWGDPREAVTAVKIKWMMRAAYYYMEQIGHEWEIRFDILEVIIPKNGDVAITHLKDAFVP